MDEGRRVEKQWGVEFWLTNTPLYCCKNLYVFPQHICSLHRHLKKSETFICQDGDGWVELSGQGIYMRPQSFVHIQAGMWHRFWTTHPNGMKMLEISTHHSDEDVERQTESGLLEYAPLLVPKQDGGE